MASQRLLTVLALFASFFALCVIGLGAFTRLLDAGLGCPDWPGCYGQIIVPMGEQATQVIHLHYPATNFVTYKAWAEMIHRYFAGTLSLFILSLIGVILCKKAVRKPSNIFLAGLLVVLIIYQIILGQLTVTLKLLPIIVTQHLLGGFFILLSLWLVYLNNKNATPLVHSADNDTVRCVDSSAARKLLPWAIMGLLLTIGQIFLGAWTSTNYASLSCSDFPFCMNDQAIVMHFKAAFQLASPIGMNYDGGVLPLAIRQTIQMTHRLGALLVVMYWFLLLGCGMKKLKTRPELLQPLFLISGLLVLQVSLGISNVIFKLPLLTAILHNVTAALLLLAMLTFIYKLNQAKVFHVQ